MSTILKAGELPHRRSRASAFHMRDLLSEAQGLINAARQQAAEIISDTQKQAQDLLEQARQEGFKRGYHTGSEQGRREGHEAAFEEAQSRFESDLKGLADTMTHITAEVDAQRQERLQAAERDLLHFAIELARRVTKRIGHVDRQVAQANLQSALRLVTSKSDLSIHVNAVDLAGLQRFAREQAEALNTYGHISFIEDDGVLPGGVKISSEGSEVDATLEAQLDQITSALTLGEQE